MTRIAVRDKASNWESDPGGYAPGDVAHLCPTHSTLVMAVNEPMYTSEFCDGCRDGCACGCGVETRGGHYLPGHDARHLALVVRANLGNWKNAGIYGDRCHLLSLPTDALQVKAQDRIAVGRAKQDA